MSVFVVHSNREFQSPVHNAAGFSKTKSLLGVYENFF